jgi:hypothetical protein
VGKPRRGLGLAKREISPTGRNRIDPDEAEFPRWPKKPGIDTVDVFILL